MTIQEAREICLRFAREHKITFTERGEVGFGRPCVGFLDGSSYITFNPYKYVPGQYGQDIKEIAEFYYEQFPRTVNSYHKHDCLAVLAHGTTDECYDAAVIELAEWVGLLEAVGPVRLVEYETGAEGMQAMFSGVVKQTVVLEGLTAGLPDWMKREE